MRSTLNDVEDGGRYFQPSSSLEFFSTGCRLLDAAIGGGWPLTRVSNIVGDKSTGKTLLAIEATNSFAKKYPRGLIRYAEAEAAFDQDYAASIGMPVDRILFTEDEDDLQFDTVEHFYNDLVSFLKKSAEADQPGLYILDSLDALSDAAELAEEDFSKGSYGTGKAKQMSKAFRMTLPKLIKQHRCHLMIVSQERDNIGVMFGKKSTRSGGRALDFFASQVLWLARKKTLDQTINKMKRAVGLEIRAKCEKNKVSIPLREVDFTLRFSFGIDDLTTSLDWLEEVGREDAALGTQKRSEFIKELNEQPDAEYWEAVKNVGDIATSVWYEIEERFKPQRARV